jgi:drug/metabolite transporter (DMT)-like permease
MAMKCYFCGAENPDSKKFCGDCGKPLEPRKIGGKIIAESDWRGFVAGFIVAVSFLLVYYSMAEDKVIPEVFLGTLSSAWGAIVAWYFFKKEPNGSATK